jgi:hypothetical protein
MSLVRAISLSVAFLAAAHAAGAQSTAQPTKFTIKVENTSKGEVLHLSNGKTAPFVSAPVLWAIHSSSMNPVFVGGQPDAGKGLETLAETGNPAPLAKSLTGAKGVVSVGAEATPLGSTAQGPIAPGQATSSRSPRRPARASQWRGCLDSPTISSIPMIGRSRCSTGRGSR